jgi:hypothetical protein
MLWYGALCILDNFYTTTTSHWEQITNHWSGLPLCLMGMEGEGDGSTCCKILVSRLCIIWGPNIQMQMPLTNIY